eukprot:607311-Lingulodinium_polyedra.AAC.1
MPPTVPSAAAAVCKSRASRAPVYWRVRGVRGRALSEPFGGGRRSPPHHCVAFCCERRNDAVAVADRRGGGLQIA